MAQTHTSEAKKSLQVPVRLSFGTEKPKVQFSITINKVQPQFIFDFWRDFSNLAIFMKDIHSIKVLSPTTSEWHVKLKSGVEASWTAKVVSEEPGRLISWKSVDGEVDTMGAVSFTPAPRNSGTIVTLAMDYKIPGGRLGELATTLIGENPEALISINLKRLRCFLETGEIATIEGQTSGRAGEDKNPSEKLH